MRPVKHKFIPLLLLFFFGLTLFAQDQMPISSLKSNFNSPPDTSKPGVYWYFMDGNISKDGITADLESMKKVGIGSVVFLEVNVGIPRGNVDFFSEEWQNLFVFAVQECQRLGIQMTLGVGPGWTGSGGPWVAPEMSMQHLVSSTVDIRSSAVKDPIILPIPAPKRPYFGENAFTPELKKQWLDFYEDVAVLAFPTPKGKQQITDVEEKALYYRAPYSSVKGTKQFLPSQKHYKDIPLNEVVSKEAILDLSALLENDGLLHWSPPPGDWTIMRFGKRNNGAITRPAPIPGLGFEADKFDTVAIQQHLDHYVGSLLKKIGTLDTAAVGGLKMLHMDSWEMGAQNWTASFRQEFITRRGYDPLPFYPVYEGRIVESEEISERFLWDIREVSQELILENHATYIKKYAHKYGLGLSIEPYDMNPTADLELGNIADVVMAEFWSEGYGFFNTAFAVVEAASVAHINGQQIVPSEAFTADRAEGFRQYPGAMKNQTDWAFAGGLNRLVYHTFQHQSLDEKLKPGMTMGPYGVHWDRNQTWWPMVKGYHDYVSRCQFLLQQGRNVADILYLAPEGAPHVFKAPPSALSSNTFMPDRKGYNFDGCAPSQLYTAEVFDHRIVFPSGASYTVLVLPLSASMTPKLLSKIRALIQAGATVIGIPPKRAPSLVNYPKNDQELQQMSTEIWGKEAIPTEVTERNIGKGKIIWGGEFAFPEHDTMLYPNYSSTAKILKDRNIPEDFSANGAIRYIHRTSNEWDIYFVSNRSNKELNLDCTFRSTKGIPALWDPISGRTKTLSDFEKTVSTTRIPMKFAAYESFFVVFSKENKKNEELSTSNFPSRKTLVSLKGSWDVAFDPEWGGPEHVVFDTLKDWSLSSHKGIKYYSGIATYTNEFELKAFAKKKKSQPIYIDIGEMKNLAKVKLNGMDVGIVWTNNQLEISNYLKKGTNTIEIEVANLWVNRLIGDQKKDNDEVKDGQWPKWLLKGENRPSDRYSFVSFQHYNGNEALLESGLLGPVRIWIASE